MHGWAGQILLVNLSSGEITRTPTRPYAEKFLGGRGIAMRFYWEQVKPGISAFSPENCLIFMAGPLVATGAQGATILSVVGKSPMTLPEGYCYGSFTGFVGAELKKAGFDGIVVEGRAEKPVYLWVHDGEAELRDAASLWGQNGYRTGELLQQTHGEKTRFIAIGAAGEKMVRTALALASHDCTVSAGFGAVLGSKNLKAIAIRGNGKIAVADPERLVELNRRTIGISRRLWMGIPPRLFATNHADLLESVGKGNCYQCGFKCIAGVYRYGKQLMGHRKCQSIESYMPWAYGKEDEPLETFFEAPVKLNDYGFDSWEMQGIVDWLYDCYQAGALTEQETGLPLSQIGTAVFLEKLMHAIAYREGLGNLLAEGLMRASTKVPEKAKAFFRPTLAPIGFNYIFPPRVLIIMGLLYPMEPRIHHMNYHEIGFVNAAWSANRHEPGSTPMTSELLHKVAKAFWGSEVAGDAGTYEGKALAAKMVLNRSHLKESLGLCDFGWPILYSYDTPDHMGDPDLIGNIFNAVTGLSAGELDRYAERIYNQQRLIMLREGRKTPEADYPLEYNFTEPLEASPEVHSMTVPGPGDEVVEMLGNKLDKAKFTAMLREYYRLRGWDEETGRPLPETLATLGMDDLISATKKPS